MPVNDPSVSEVLGRDIACIVLLKWGGVLHAAESHFDHVVWVRPACQRVWHSVNDVAGHYDYRYRGLGRCKHAACVKGFQVLDSDEPGGAA